MSLNIMIAGCAKEEKDGVSSSVKKALSDRPGEEAWSVSVVKVTNQWSVTIDGPEPRFKGLSLVAPLEDLAGSLRAAIGNAGAPPATAPLASNGASANERTDRYDCEGCSAPFEVIYVAAAGEREEVCPVACPQCWHVNHVPIAAGAGLNGDYRARAAVA